MSLLGADDSRRRGSLVPSSYRADPPARADPRARSTRPSLSPASPLPRHVLIIPRLAPLPRATRGGSRGIAGCRGCIGGVSAPRRVSILARRLRRRLHLRHAPLLAFHPLPRRPVEEARGAVPPSPSHTAAESWASFDVVVSEPTRTTLMNTPRRRPRPAVVGCDDPRVDPRGLLGVAQAGVVARDGPRHRVRLARRARARGARRRRAHHHRGCTRRLATPRYGQLLIGYDRRDPHLQPRRRVRRARRRRRPLHGRSRSSRTTSSRLASATAHEAYVFSVPRAFFVNPVPFLLQMSEDTRRPMSRHKRKRSVGAVARPSDDDEYDKKETKRRVLLPTETTEWSELSRMTPRRMPSRPRP